MIKQILHRLNRRDTRFLPKSLTPTKIILIILILFTITFTAKILLAEDDTTSNSSIKIPNETIEAYKAKQAAFGKGNNQESWINESLGSNAMSIFQAIGGTIPDNVLEGKTTSWIPGGIIGFTNQTIAQLYNPPASGVEYIAQSVNNFLGKPVYAQAGFTGLSGIQSIWKVFRNAVYILISVIFVVIGLMIMLRIKISPQAIVTIQSTIPKLITTLILVTFSYAIAGLLIDLSYVFQALTLSLLFSSKGAVTSEATLFSGANNPPFSDMMNAGFGVFSALTFRAVPFGLLTLLAIIPSAIIGGIIGATGIFTFGAGWILGISVGAISFSLIIAIIAIFILIQVVKFFFGIAKCYINLILKIILGPLEIGLGAIPGSKMGFSSWITQVIAYLAVFPVSLIFLVLSNMIIQAITNDNLWAPSILDSSIIAPLIGLSTLMLLSRLPSIIPEMVFQIKPTAIGKALGEGFGHAGKSVTGMATMGMGAGLDRVNEKYGSADNKGNNMTGGVRRPDNWWNKVITGSRTAWNDSHKRK